MPRKKTLTVFLLVALVLTIAVLLLVWNKRLHSIKIVTWEDKLHLQQVGVSDSPTTTATQEPDVENVDDVRYVAQFDYGLLRHHRRRRKIPVNRKRQLPIVSYLYKTNATTAVSPLSVKFPHYFIIGFAKTGTKALYELLKLHSQLSGPRRELRYFSHEEHYNSTLYLSHFPYPPSNGYTIEKSPDYILSTAAAIRIKQAALSSNLNTSSDIKFIVVLRNPVVRTVSDYLEMQIWTILYRKSRLPEFPDVVLTSQGAVNGSEGIINSSCYIYHLKQWLQFFDLKQFCFVSGDDFVTDPYKEVKNLEKCLQLERFFTEDHFVYNSQKGFYCFKTNSGSNERTLCMNRTKGRPHPHVSEHTIKLLKEYFRPYNEELYSQIGRIFDWENSMKY